jgi:hypothetical protein
VEGVSRVARQLGRMHLKMDVHMVADDVALAPPDRRYRLQPMDVGTSFYDIPLPKFGDIVFKRKTHAADADDVASFLHAAESGDVESLSKLLALGVHVDVEEMSGSRRTALQVAATKGHESVVRLLLNAGADRDHRDANGVTPVVAALQFEHVRLAKLMTAHESIEPTTTTIGGKRVRIVSTSNHTRLSSATSFDTVEHDVVSRRRVSTCLFAC